jgi:catalase
MWANAGGERYWVKYHFKTDQGVDHLTEAEGHEIGGQDPDHHIKDLYGAIKSGDHPSWTLYMQVMPFADAADYRFNPFDLTKVWPHGDYPLVKVGRMVLDRNPDNYFAEVEQSAFEPNNMVPGIGPSPDKMLLARLFSYHDTHLHRIGANATQLPVNAPRYAPVRSYNRDGAMRYENPGDPVYAPNSFGGPAAGPEMFGPDPSWHVTGEILRSAYTLHKEDDDFGQANAMVNEAMDQAARQRLVSNVVGHASQDVTEPVLSRVVAYWRNIDKVVGDQVAAGLAQRAQV